MAKTANETTPDIEHDDSQVKDKRSGIIQSVTVAARFLDILANADGPLALSEIARRGKTGSPTAHRYMQSLISAGLVAQNELSGRYDLGPATLNIGLGALRRIDPVEVAARHMKTMSSKIAASCGVAIWTDRGPTIVRWYRSAYFSISTVSLGDVLPLDNSACGQVFQAHLDPEKVNAARKLQPAGFRGKTTSQSTLAAVRDAPLTELNEHLFNSLTGKAVPVFDAQNEIVCVMTTVSLISSANEEAHAELLLEAARQVAIETGNKRP